MEPTAPSPSPAVRWTVLVALVLAHFAVASNVIRMGVAAQLLAVGVAVAAVTRWWGPAWLPLSLGRVGLSLRVCAKAGAIAAGVGALYLATLLIASHGFGLRWPLRAAAFARPDLFDDYLIVAMIWAPLIEEVFYRGFVQARLVDLTGRLRGVVLSALIFWVYHWVALGVVSLHHLIAGVVFAWAYDRTRSLLAPLLLHALANLVLGVRTLVIMQHGPELTRLLGW